MALDPVAASSQSDGRWKIAYVPSGSAANSVAIINGGTSKALTYSFTADGFNWTLTQATVEDKRLTLVQDLSRPGKVTEVLEVKYVDSTDTGSAAVVLAAGTAGQLTVRRGVDNATAWTVAQTVDIITFVAGVPRHDPPTENGLDTVSQTLYITAPTQRGVSLVS